MLLRHSKANRIILVAIILSSCLVPIRSKGGHRQRLDTPKDDWRKYVYKRIF